MTQPEILDAIRSFVNETRQNKGLPAITVQESTALLGGDAGLDSLDLAALVVELQSATERDPFEQGFINFTTAGELAELFAGVRA
ncbi:MAG TPA: hypothetical protein VJN64_04885 [Terriglobales bacterium]|nr:hypothetical protein [Terriglobales bacterium]